MDNGQNSELVKSLFSAKFICSVENMWRQMWYYLSVKEYISAWKKTKFCTPEWYYLLVARVYTLLCKKKSTLRQTVQRKIILCYLLLSEVYAHPFFGLHCLADEGGEPPKPVLESCAHVSLPSQLSHDESNKGPSPKPLRLFCFRIFFLLSFG